MKKKRAKIKFLMTVLGETYWSVSLKQRLARLNMCLNEDKQIYEHIEGLA